MAHQQRKELREEVTPLPIVGAKDILVHLDWSAEDEIRIAHAEGLAATFGARLTDVYTNALPNLANYAAPESGEACVELENELRAEGHADGRRLARRFERLGVPQELRKFEAEMGELRRAVATEARWADLFVASCPRGDARRWNPVIEEVLFQGGRGVLLAPEGVKPRAASVGR